MDLITVDYRKELLNAANAYCKRHDMKLTTLGKRLMKDHRFFENISDGSGCTVDTFQRLMKELSETAIKSPNKKLTIVDGLTA